MWTPVCHWCAYWFAADVWTSVPLTWRLVLHWYADWCAMDEQTGVPQVYRSVCHWCADRCAMDLQTGVPLVCHRCTDCCATDMQNGVPLMCSVFCCPEGTVVYTTNPMVIPLATNTFMDNKRVLLDMAGLPLRKLWASNVEAFGWEMLSQLIEIIFSHAWYDMTVVSQDDWLLTHCIYIFWIIYAGTWVLRRPTTMLLNVHLNEE